MRIASPRPARTSPVSVLAALAAVLAAACTFVACSSSGGGTGGGEGGPGDATSEGIVESGGGSDSPAPDASDSPVVDASEASDSPAGDASADADDASLDAPTVAPAMMLADAFSGDCGAGSSGEPVDLSCTGLYSDFAAKTVASDVQAYTPGLVLWSDGADKQRWIYLPPGQKIDTSDMDEWTFPVGTKVFKEFSLPLEDGGAPVRIETRMIWKRAVGSWYPTTYRWSADGTTSTTELLTGQLDVDGLGYEVPSQGECYTCHEGRQDFVLGFEAVALSAPAAQGLTMTQLEAMSLLTVAPTGSLAVPGDAIQAPILGWLHANCGVACHNRGNTGQASFSGFYMRLDVATLASVPSTDVYTTGWDQMTKAFFIPGATSTYRLLQCNTAQSAAYYRADHRDGVDGIADQTQMPPIDSHKVDSTAMAQLAAWINEGCDGGTTDAGDE